MHPVTRELYPLLVDPAVPVQQKFDRLHNAYAGETAFILACGPSISEYAPARLQELLTGKLVLCIKQAYDVVVPEADYLLLNSWNFRRYDLSKGSPVVVRESGPTDPAVFHRGHIELNIPKPSGRDEQLALSKRFDDYMFSRQLARPWGPGVLYELGFYFVEHFGATKVVTLGWDVGVKNSPQMPHFYDTTSPEIVKLIRKSREIDDLTERNRFLHDNDIVYNRPRIIPEEVDDCAAVSQDWANWLSGRGIQLKVASRQSLASDIIPRTRIEDEV
jgi:hypothetical protein